MRTLSLPAAGLEHRVEQADGAQVKRCEGTDDAWGWGPPRGCLSDGFPKQRFSGLRNPVFEAGRRQRRYRVWGPHLSDMAQHLVARSPA